MSPYRLFNPVVVDLNKALSWGCVWTVCTANMEDTSHLQVAGEKLLPIPLYWQMAYSGLRKYSPPWHFSYFVAFVSFDLLNMPTTLKMQNIFYCEKQEIRQKKLKLERVIIHPPQSTFL